MINYWPLLGIALVVLGFALRFNPLLVVAVSAIVTGLLGGLDFLKVLATVGRLLIGYLAFRQVFAAAGLKDVAGHAQTVRPLIAPMALAAAEKQHGKIDEETADTVKAYAAATDNVGLFFGE